MNKPVQTSDNTSRCSKCGVCSSVCPTYGATGSEAFLARGRLSLIEAERSGGIGMTHAFEERVTSCTGCLACTARCPAGLDPATVIREARNRLIRDRGGKKVTRLIARHALTGSDAPPLALRFLSGPGGKALASAGRALKPLTAKTSRPLPPSETGGQPLTRLIPEVSRAAQPSMRVAFFPGCATSLVYPETGLAAVRTLNAAGVDVVTPQGLKCCGLPFLSLDEEDHARMLAQANFSNLARLKTDYIVTVCSSCALALKHELPRLLGEGNTVVREVSSRVLDIHQLLARLVDDGRIEPNLPRQNKRGRRIAWHDPCHLRWGLGVHEEPREIIARLPGVEYAESGNDAGCCGGAGLFRLAHPSLAIRIGRSRAEEIAASGADVVATGCPGCRTQLSEMFAREKLDIPVVHTVQLLAAGCE